MIIRFSSVLKRGFSVTLTWLLFSSPTASAFDRVVLADGTFQEIELIGRDGHDGSNAHCFSDDRRRNGKDGSNGRDAGTVLIQYRDLADLQNIRIRSKGGQGGDGGRGCNGGFRGSDGSDGEPAKVYLYPIGSDGSTYESPLARLRIKPEHLGQEIRMSKNFWETRSGVLQLLARGSSASRQYQVFKSRSELSARVTLKNLAEKDAEELSLVVNEDATEVQLSGGLGALPVFEKRQNGEVTEFTVSSVLDSQELFGFDVTLQGKRKHRQMVLSYSSDLGSLIADGGAKYKVIVYRKRRGFWPFPIHQTLGQEAVTADLITTDGEKVVIDIGKLNLDRYKRSFVRERLGLEVTYTLSGNRVSKMLYFDQKI